MVSKRKVSKRKVGVAAGLIAVGIATVLLWPPSPPPGEDVIINGGFVSDTDNWSFEVVAGAPTSSWDSAGYENGGCAKVSSGVGRNKSGEGDWEQTITTTIEAGSTVTLLYAWKKGYAVKAPAQQDIYVSIVKPDATTVDIDSQLEKPAAYDTWYTVSNKDVSASFDQTGMYKIRLRYDYKTGPNASAQVFAWFDEVELFVAPPPLPVPPAEGKWVDKAETPEVGGYGEGVVGTGSYIYVAKTLYASSTPRFWRYDPTANSWTNMSITGLPTGAFRNGTALEWDNSDYIYALGGARYSDADRRLFFRYSISDDNWTQMVDTPGPQGAGDAITWSGYDGYIYAILGSSGHGTVFARYDATNNTWENKTSPPADTDDGASLAWTGGAYLYALRGEYIETEPLRDFWRYDIVNDNWATMENIPEEGGVGDGGSMIWVGNWLPEHSDYIYGLGGGSCWEDAGENYYRYSISNDSWEKLADIPYPIGYYVGNRLGFANDHIYYWQGTPSAYPGGGKKFSMYEFPT